MQEPKISLAEIEQFKELEQKLASSAEAILKQIHEIRPIKGYDYLSFDRINCCDRLCVFRGEERWAYGGHEEYECEFPIELLYDGASTQLYFDNLKKLNDDDRKVERAAVAHERRERKKKYEELKKEFDHD